jgi:putative hydrolase of the HAD superfamily
MLSVQGGARVDITHVFFDIGGVLGTNGWDREQRARAAEAFGLDEEFERRHGELVGELEAGRMTLDEYLEIAVFYGSEPRAREGFKAFMLAQSEPFPESLEIARELAADPRLRLMTLNNESEELNVHRIERFGLRPIFSAFLSSCWLAARKPGRLIFQRALGISQADPARALFIDDRDQNLVPARALGFRTLLFTDAAALRQALVSMGLLPGGG